MIHPRGGYVFGGGVRLILPVFTGVFLILGAQAWALSADQARPNMDGVLGGPGAVIAPDNGFKLAYLEASSPVMIVADTEDAGAAYEVAGFSYFNDAELEDAGSILGGALSKRDGLLIYKAQKGDTVSGVAASFGISLDTVLWANPKIKGKILGLDQEVVILPVSGVLYEVRDGETTGSIAALFGVDEAKIISVNQLKGSDTLEAGKMLVVPDGTPIKSLTSLAAASSLPDYKNYYAFPAPKSSQNWGRLHAENAVDIANVCGTDVYASADGLVTEVGEPANWNGGYGGFVRVEHQNGTETLYAHTDENLVQVGSLVNKGDEIAKIGRTGNVHGPTGCHLHFEVHGAKNPFVK